MSDDQAKKNFEANLAVEKRKQEVQLKKLAIDERLTESKLKRIEQSEKELDTAKNANFGSLSKEQIQAIRKDNTDYMNAAKTGMTFINDEFKGVVPYFRKNLILLGGKTGDGKSTTVANIVYETIKQNTPDGKKRRALVITNEEKSGDVYNRVTCLAKGWAYVNHDKFNQEQLDTFDQWIGHLAGTGVLTVIDDSYNGGLGLTTSIEGLTTIFDNLLRDKEFYDVIIIDYYQNFKYSKNDPSLNEWAVQAMVSSMLDQYKNVYPAPIIMMAQVEAPDEERSVPFTRRIKGRKVITDVATCIVELIANREDYKTEWMVHKSRFNERVGQSFDTGFDKGRYVPYNTEFKAKVLHFKEQRMYGKAMVPTEADKESGKNLKDIMEKMKNE